MEKEEFDKNFVWQDSYDDDQGDRDDKIEENLYFTLFVLYTFDGYTVLLCT